MFCKNCGNPVDPNAAICVNCGYQNGAGNGFCTNCGKATAPGAAVCMNCGCALNNQQTVQGYVGPTSDKSRMAAGLLGIFLGAFGVHNFYLGFKGKAIAQLLISVLSCFTLAVVSEIWGLVEGIMILTNKNAVDAQGNVLKD